MNERPILFSGEMVRAILEGRKTQTRRVVIPQPSGIRKSPFVASGLEDIHGWEIKLKYGQPGDRLWVRETWKLASYMEGEPLSFQYKADGAVLDENDKWEDAPNYESWNDRICWKADLFLQKIKYPVNEDTGNYEWSSGESPLPWQSSIFMPRWASRITLEIVNIRVERLQEISEEDAKAEGVELSCGQMNQDCPNYKRTYHQLWNSLYAKRGYSWEKNPWVWVIEFEVVTNG